MRFAIAAGVFLIAAVIAPSHASAAPRSTTRDAHPIPRQLDRADFPRPEAAWLVAYFSSTTCAGCQGLAPKVAVLESNEVATRECSFETNRDLHERYDISAIPMVLIANKEGVVERAFIGHTTATDLWAAVAEAREPGSSPEPTLGNLG